MNYLKPHLPLFLLLIFASLIVGAQDEYTEGLQAIRLAYLDESQDDLENLVNHPNPLPVISDSIVKDIDGNSYRTRKFANQVWMIENLKTSHFADGTSIRFVNKRSDWKRLSAFGSAYCWLADDSLKYAETYGALYTWAAAMNGERPNSESPGVTQGVCPEGWHLPSDEEWKELEMHLGMNQASADYIKKRGANEGSKLADSASLWNDGQLDKDPDFGTSGFEALPGSYRYDFGQFYSVGYFGSWWTSTEINPLFAWHRSISYSFSGVYRYTLDKKYGLSVRCVKD